MVEWSKKRPVLGGIGMVVMLWAGYIVSTVLRGGSDEASRYWIDSLLRCAFGIWGIRLFARVFYDGDWRQVIHLRGFGKGLAAGWGKLAVMVIIALIGCFFGENFTWGPWLVGGVVMQQIGTGVFEEVTFRAMLLEGGMRRFGGKWWARLLLATVNGAIFALMHFSIFVGNPSRAFFYFVSAFTYAAMYLYSGNILSCMVVHAVYDIPANLNRGFAVVAEQPLVWGVIYQTVVWLMSITSVVLVLRAKPWAAEICETEHEASNTTE